MSEFWVSVIIVVIVIGYCIWNIIKTKDDVDTLVDLKCKLDENDRKQKQEEFIKVSKEYERKLKEHDEEMKSKDCDTACEDVPNTDNYALFGCFTIVGLGLDDAIIKKLNKSFKLDKWLDDVQSSFKGNYLIAKDMLFESVNSVPLKEAISAFITQVPNDNLMITFKEYLEAYEAKTYGKQKSLEIIRQHIKEFLTSTSKEVQIYVVDDKDVNAIIDPRNFKSIYSDQKDDGKVSKQTYKALIKVNGFGFIGELSVEYTSSYPSKLNNKCLVF